MKKYIKVILPVCAMMMASLATLSCSSPDEVPPRRDESVTIKKVKMPDPTTLSNDEQATVDAIADEYHKATDE